LEKQELEREFREKLDLFCFFHLGADARVDVVEQQDQLRISVEHHRVEPFQFAVSFARLQQLLKEPDHLERFMLDEITPHRR
jgi:hypothetical protein